jgi:hypothetical protein
VTHKNGKVNVKYKVHRLDVKSDTMQEMLEQLLSRLTGEVVAVVPNVRPIFRPMGATSRVDFLLVIEKVR